MTQERPGKRERAARKRHRRSVIYHTVGNSPNFERFKLGRKKLEVSFLDHPVVADAERSEKNPEEIKA